MGSEDQKDKLVTGGDILELWKHVDVNRYFKEVRMHRVEVCLAPVHVQSLRVLHRS